MREVGVPAAFPEQVAREAEAARAAADGRERVEIPFVTVDPARLEGSRSGAQSPSGRRVPVSYAIADVAALVAAGAARRRGPCARGDRLRPGREGAALPAGALGRLGSLLAGQWRPAVLWTIDLDAAGEQTAVHVRG